MSRRWKAGDRLMLDGLVFRVQPGRKGEYDLTISWLTPDGWHKVSMSSVFALADFLCENEEYLYPPPQRGGQMLLDAIASAVQHGWRHAADALQQQKMRRRGVSDSGY